MKLAALVSGGKDSLFAAYVMHSQGFEVKYLVTMLPEREDSYMFHHPNVHLTQHQAQSIGIPLLTKSTKGEEEKELQDLKEIISSAKDEIGGVVSGAVFSEYQKQRIDVVCEELNLVSFAPLWHKNPEMLLREMLEAGFEIAITAVAAHGLNESWLGRRIDERCIEELKELNKKYKIHISGEGGEFETLVLDMPMFGKKMEILKARKKLDATSGIYTIEGVRLVDK
ncbi:MAG: TIGR00289 family protein [Euryarchaeota archaeon]|nr:TIGR00289 family protein [Euryarchaeota archaeon]